MSGGQPPNNKKRNASTAGMGPPDQRSTTKRSRLDTALETKLTECKSVLQPDELRVSWEDYDPGSFMKSMQQLSRVINALDLKTVGKYISNGGLAADLFTLDVQGTKLKTGLEDPLMDTDVKRAREIMITYVTRVRACLNALVEQANAKPAPSYFADHNEWRVWQEKSDAILCLRPAKQKGLPIPLMHPAFCTFTRHFYEPLLDEHITKYLSTSKQLCQVMPSAFDSEKARREAFEEIFGSLDMKVQSHVEFYILPKVSQVSTVMESGGTTDVVKTINYGGGHLVLILEEFKVESTGDAYMQICRSYEGLCGDAKNESLLKFGNPTFLLCILGPYLMVCGAVKRENVHVEPLTPFLPMFPGFGTEGRLMQLTHCLRALKEGTDKLREFWQDVGITKDANEMVTVDSLPEPYLVSGCPDNGLLRFDDWRGTFESRMGDGNDSDKLPSFLAKIRKADGDGECEKQVVVKFVYNYSGTYGTAVHKYLQSIGLAPALYSAEPLHRGLVMVVMEYLRFEDGTGGWVELDTFKGNLDTKEHVVREKLKKIIKHLQDQNMVHADLRPTNIMIKVDGKGDMMIDENEPILSVVDFDWAGIAGKVCYPPLLNPKVPWPTGAKAYKEVGQDDDRVLLDNWWGAFVKGKTAK